MYPSNQLVPLLIAFPLAHEAGQLGRTGAGVCKDRPRHDDALHGADAFLTFACSNDTPPSALPTRERDTRWIL